MYKTLSKRMKATNPKVPNRAAPMLRGKKKRGLSWPGFDGHLKRAMSLRPDQHLTLDALAMAVRQRRVRAGLIHHSDQGAQYSALLYRRRLAEMASRRVGAGKAIAMTTRW